MNIIVLDTETINLTKPFVYDIGYLIIDTETGKVLDRFHRVVEQIWHNRLLFETAYYQEKRPLYVDLMRKHEAIMDKYGYIMQEMIRNIHKYDVQAVYAFNSDFDDKAIAYTCDWFKCNNPLDNIPVYDIMAYATNFITPFDDYKQFCDLYECYTEAGNYSQNAETIFRYLTKDNEYTEEHMGLQDSEIEKAILIECINRGAEWNTTYTNNRFLTKETYTPYTVKVNGQIIHDGVYTKKYIRNNVYSFMEQGQ